ncbi:MAG TPA: hypothetical protein QF772_09600 [Nitrospinaceae bacterium]|nr:hypothetical protein [Nitrospinaceae bacterium]
MSKNHPAQIELRAVADMPKKFNENSLKAIEATQEAVGICRQAMIDANDESCRAMYPAILKDCEKHSEILNEEIELRKK